MERQFLRRWFRCVLAFTAAVFIAAGSAASASAAANSYTVTNLVSDVPGLAAHVDPDLVNAWGLTSLPTSPWWVADNGTDVSTLYRADGSKVSCARISKSSSRGSDQWPQFWFFGE